jgi:hypothetical protein
LSGGEGLGIWNWGLVDWWSVDLVELVQKVQCSIGYKHQTKEFGIGN